MSLLKITIKATDDLLKYIMNTQDISFDNRFNNSVGPSLQGDEFTNTYLSYAHVKNGIYAKFCRIPLAYNITF